MPDGGKCPISEIQAPELLAMLRSIEKQGYNETASDYATGKPVRSLSLQDALTQSDTETTGRSKQCRLRIGQPSRSLPRWESCYEPLVASRAEQ